MCVGAEIVGLLDAYTEGKHVRIFPTTHFGYRKITVERPLRLNFQAIPERIARLETEPAFRALAESRKKGAARELDEATGREQQAAIRRVEQNILRLLAQVTGSGG